MTRVVEINDLAALGDCRLVWQSLLLQTPGASFFQTLDWLEAYWRHFGQGQQLRVLLVHAAGGPVGILPLVVRRERTRLGPIRVLTYPLDEWGSFYGPIGPNPTATLLAGLGHIARAPRDWAILDLAWLHPHLDAGRSPRAMACKGLSPHQRVGQPTAQIDLSGSWDDYWASRTSRWRNNVRRAEKQLAARGRIDYVRYRPAGAVLGDDDPRWDLYEACLTVAGSSWQARSTTGTTMTHAPICEFLRDAHAAAARAGCLDLNLLLLDGAPVAFNYAYHLGGHVFGLRTGYDATAREGAGSVLQYRMIQDSFDRGDRSYDLGSGYLECKRPWLTRLVDRQRCTFFAPTSPRAQALRVKRSVGNWLTRRGKLSNQT
jgi:CelD/BcsL family acetyltransferase involved in cellulose biosynthesis